MTGSLSEYSAKQLLQILNESDELTRVEAKRGRHDGGDSALESVCAFSNEPHLKGGYIIFGVAPVSDSFWPLYEAVGVEDPDKLQCDLSTRCNESFNRTIRPDMKVEMLNGANVVVAFIPEASPSLKPVYFKKDGLPHGAYRRIGPTDHRCTEEDLVVFYQGRAIESYDAAICSDSTMSDFDKSALAEYRRARSVVNDAAPELQLGNTEMLQALKCAKFDSDGKLRPTVCGLILFGKKEALRREFSTLRIDYIRIPGARWVKDISKADHRIGSVELLGPLIHTIHQMRNTIIEDLPKAFDLPSDEMEREEVPIVPNAVIREAVVNAVMHRSYRNRGSIEIIRYSNRLEIRNPGHSLKSEERFDEPGSEPRNPQIAAVLHDINLAETKGLGIQVMRESMRNCGLQPPHLESDRIGDQFVVRLLFHHFLGQDDLEWLSNFQEYSLTDDDRRALIFVREVGAIDNQVYRSFSSTDTLAASGRLRRLRDCGLLEKKGKGSRTYYVGTELLLNPEVLTPKPDELTGKPEELGVKPEEFVTEYVVQVNSAVQAGDLDSLPAHLQKMVDRLPNKASETTIFRVILSLCAWRKLKASEIAAHCNRNPNYLRSTTISKLLDKELLGITESHRRSPNVKYQTTDKGEE